MTITLPDTLDDALRTAYLCADPAEKATWCAHIAHAHRSGALERRANAEPSPIPPVETPGRPSRPALVAPNELPRRGLGSQRGRILLIHAIAHIEFNAMNLALDAALRFPDLPDAYYADWIGVASEEAYHFTLLTERLAELAHEYGDFPAHAGLWSMACKTADDPLSRMALVPRVMEARGLDVTPAMQARLRHAGDERTAEILQTILDDEIGHVAIGSRWYRYLCEQRGLDPQSTFNALIERYFDGQLRGPFNHEARLEAGFSRAELSALEKGTVR